jgi:hypothetical protein
MNYSIFNKYINDKYGYNSNTDTWSVLDPYITSHNWEKIITQFESSTQTTTVNTIQIDEDTYNNLIESTETYSIHTITVIITTTKKAVNYYDWELQKNESKRTIKLLNELYVDQLETEFKKLMK